MVLLILFCEVKVFHEHAQNGMRELGLSHARVPIRGHHQGHLNALLVVFGKFDDLLIAAKVQVEFQVHAGTVGNNGFDGRAIRGQELIANLVGRRFLSSHVVLGSFRQRQDCLVGDGYPHLLVKNLQLYLGQRHIIFLLYSLTGIFQKHLERIYHGFPGRYLTIKKACLILSPYNFAYIKGYEKGVRCSR